MARPPLVEFVAARLTRLTAPDARCLVAVSGGPDSMALLDLLHRGAGLHGRELVVAHVDHGIDPASAFVADRVAREAAVRRIACHLATLALGPGTSETVARRARRRVLRQLADRLGASAIVLAHQADDQAETVLLRLLHGSGPAGLAGMVARRGRWVRPLLAVPRDELRAHLTAAGIESWDDPSNRDLRHLRSWLRTEVLPVIERRMPAVRARLVKAAGQAAAQRAAWNGVSELIPALQFCNERHGISVAVAPLCGYRSAVRRAILATLGRRFGVPLGRRRLGVLDELLRKPSGSGRRRLSRRLEAELHDGRLTFYLASGVESPAVPVAVGHDGAVGDARFQARAGPADTPARCSWQTTMMPGRYLARPWRPGDRIRPLNGRGSRAVAVLFREARVAPHRRAGWPVVVDADDATIVWVPGICRSDARLPQPGSEAWHVECAFA